MNRKRKKLIANIIISLFLVCGVLWIASIFFHPGGEWTNNAQVKQDIVPVSSRVNGFIKEIRFEEFTEVHKGDTLVVIDDSELALRLAQAKADLESAKVNRAATESAISTTRNNLAVVDASMKEVSLQLDLALQDYNRHKNLFANGAATRQQLDAATTRYESLKAKLETMKAQKHSTELAVKEQKQRLGQCDSHIAVCEAAISLAELNLSYAAIVAPCDGNVSRRTIQAGELVMSGKVVLSIVSNEEKWVVANFRETQMAGVVEGAKVKIKADAVDNKEYEGVVRSISSATGAQLSLAATDNSAGSFVKIEQRLPVKIVFTTPAEQLADLRSGMNVECLVISK